MSRNWKTVYRSAHRKVLVRPASGKPQTRIRSKLLLRERVYGKSALDSLFEVIGAVGAMFLVLIFFVYLLDACWPLFVLTIILVSACTPKRPRPK